RLTVREPDLPVVERTGDAVLEDEALREGSALVRTAVQQREDAIAGGAEDRDVRAARAPQHAGARGLDVLERADVEPSRPLFGEPRRFERRRRLDGFHVGVLHASSALERFVLARVDTRLRRRDRKSTRLNSSHVKSSYAALCLKKKRPTQS